MTRNCSTCGKQLHLSSFYKSGYNSDGSVKYSSECKDCRKEREMQRYYEKKKIIDAFKTPCVHCGLNKPYLIEFHHRDPNEKEFVIAHWRKKSNELLQKELQKCDPLCRNCHEEFHFLNKTEGLQYSDYIAKK